MYVTFWPVESIIVGLYALALSIITVCSVALSTPGGLGTIRGSTLGFGTRALNSVVLGIAKGAANGGKRSLCFIKVTECGSPTSVGLIQVIVCPASIAAFCGT